MGGESSQKEEKLTNHHKMSRLKNLDAGLQTRDSEASPPTTQKRFFPSDEYVLGERNNIHGKMQGVAKMRKRRGNRTSRDPVPLEGGKKKELQLLSRKESLRRLRRVASQGGRKKNRPSEWGSCTRRNKLRLLGMRETAIPEKNVETWEVLRKPKRKQHTQQGKCEGAVSVTGESGIEKNRHLNGQEADSILMYRGKNHLLDGQPEGKLLGDPKGKIECGS